MQVAVPPQEYQRQCILAAVSSRLNPFALDKREADLLQGWTTEKRRSEYLNIRNGILRLWTRNPLVCVEAHEAALLVKNKALHTLVYLAHEWLARHGYINFGCIDIRFDHDTERRGKSLPTRRRILIIGAGMSGLSCARQIHGLCSQFQHLLLNGAKQPRPEIIVLEGRTRVGGRVYSHPFAKQVKGTLPHEMSETAELGAQIITGFDSGNPLDAIIRGQLALEHHFLKDNTVFYDHDGTLIEDKQRDARMDRLFNTILEAASKHSWKLVNKSATVQLPVENGREDSVLTIHGVNGIQDVDSKGSIKLPNSLGAMMDRLVERYREDVTLSSLDLRLLNWHYANMEYANAANVSQLSLGGWDQDGGNEFEGRHSQVVGGYTQVPRALWQYPSVLDIRFRREVTKVDYGSKNNLNEEGRVEVHCANGQVFSADHVVCTVPLGVLKENKLQFLPPLPDWKAGAIKRLGFGVLNKVILVFDDVFWEKDRDMFGLLNQSSLRDSKDQKDYAKKRGKFYLFWNCIRTSGRPMLVALMAGDAAHAAEITPDHLILGDVLDKLRKMFKLEHTPRPIEAIITRWKKDPFARGSYSYVAPTAQPDDYDAMAQPVNSKLFFAGEATCVTHPATVHGAYLSGLRAASEVFEAMVGPIPNWRPVMFWG